MQDTGFYLQEDKKERLADVYDVRLEWDGGEAE